MHWSGLNAFFACAVLAAPLTAATAADLTGTWALEFARTGSRDAYQGDCTFKHEGERLSGSCLSGFENLVPVSGDVKDTAVTFRFVTGLGEGTTATFSGELDAPETSIRGTWRFVDPDGKEGGGTFTATRR